MKTKARPPHPAPADIQVSAAPRVDDVVILEDGRRLGYAEWGDATGPPVFLFHGRPGSRLFCPDLKATLRAGARLITIDRPGYGRSDPRPGRRLEDNVNDVVALADRLGLERFAVIGWSSGGPNAMACGARRPARVSAVGIVCSEAPWQLVPAETWTPAARALFAQILADPDGAIANLTERFQWYADDPDELVRRILGADGTSEQVPGIRAAYLTWFREGARHGLAGLVEDFVAETLPWGFDLEDVRGPIWQWWGGRDPLVHPAHAYLLSRRLDCVSNECPDCDHELAIWHWEDILGRVTRA